MEIIEVNKLKLSTMQAYHCLGFFRHCPLVSPNTVRPYKVVSSSRVQFFSPPLGRLFQALFLLLLVIVSSGVLATEISVSVDRNPVSIDESFKIVFAADEAPDGNPDFTPLDKDFIINAQNQGSNSSWVNGTYSNSIQWTLEVTAKKAGKLVIPAILFGNDTSEPLNLEVTQSAADNATTQTKEEIFLEVKASPDQPYVQSQIIYTIRLYRRVDVARAELSEPELADAVIEKLGEDSNFNTVVNGVSYLVTERKYAIFPQKSGTITIKPLALTAAVILDRQPDFRDLFGSRITKSKRVLSEPVTLNVKPAPASFTGKEWLAAEKIDLSQDWSGDIQQMKVGEPLTRTLTLQGIGTTVGQLPELSTSKTDTRLKAYPDQPVLNEQKLPDGITSTRQEKIALIPSTMGKHILPAIEIPWFNTKTQTIEIARIPETTITVIGAGENQPETTPAPKVPAPSTSPLAEPKAPSPISINTEPYLQNSWIWATLFFALGWLLTLVYFLRKRPKKIDSDKDEQWHITETNTKESIRKLKEACAHNDALAAKAALLSWGKIKFAAHNLGEIASQCDAQLRGEILHLNRILYGKESSQWTGKKLLQAFTENKVTKTRTRHDESILEPLHRIY